MIRILVHLGCITPLCWLAAVLFYDTESLGADPIKELQHFLGFTALTILIALFLWRIIAKMFKFNRLLTLHRALGLWTLFYTLLHILSYLILELNLDITLFFSELSERVYLLIGLFSFLALCFITIIAVPFIRNKINVNWLSLHRMSYLALLLAVIHYHLSTKAIKPTVILYAVIIGLIFIFAYYQKKYKLK
ncbi:sulfoxide reductase heme-binding subunit YedZ [Cricetibacter osteomyelitidis]|uniref:Protein-methionine-sulfoxide reductase heme-binding subunit MsrQ n=1 Tax=Cricetibacter osteomyelitidis TaxID=1521931 RepID=A0A4R2SV52_9PAST|nr:ferric reductase-like transmembrane domain-containing protein [Cricetibacter osteomyelitidis]TCP92224.1 sulfoxide reductase heme-binding subunit YedZ [Cricetibacter osteomyelitidis]